jgi:phage terminase Nu1 subunit (DNA packaging protein)
MTLREEYLTVADLAALLGKSERTIQNWIYARYGPPVVRVKGRSLFRADSVRKWLAAHERESRPAAR